MLAGYKAKMKGVNMTNQVKGSIYTLLSAFFFGTYGIWSKIMGKEFDEFFQGWTRSLIILAILIPIGLLFNKFKKIEKSDVKYFMIFGIPGALVIPTYYYGFVHASIGVSYLLLYAALTITTYVMGILFFNERMNAIKYSSLGLGIVGLILIFSFKMGLSFLPLFMTTLAGIFSGIEVSFTKKVSERYSPLQLTVFMYGVCFIICIVMYLLDNNFTFVFNLNKEAWLGNIGHAISSLFAFYFVVIGYKYLEPSIGGIVGLLEIPIGIALGIAILGEKLTITIVIGAIVIILAALLPNITELMKLKLQKRGKGDVLSL